jgi:hypothetical protein
VYLQHVVVVVVVVVVDVVVVVVASVVAVVCGDIYVDGMVFDVGHILFLCQWCVFVVVDCCLYYYPLFVFLHLQSHP